MSIMYLALVQPSSFLCRMEAAISADLLRSMTLENLPTQLKTSVGVTRTKASPELMDLAVGSIRRGWQYLRPFTWISITSPSLYGLSSLF